MAKQQRKISRCQGTLLPNHYSLSAAPRLNLYRIGHVYEFCFYLKFGLQ